MGHLLTEIAVRALNLVRALRLQGTRFVTANAFWRTAMADVRSSGLSMPPMGQSTSLVPPLYQSSVFTLPDLDALDQILNAEQPGFIYARDGHPNARYLADQLASLEGADWAIICGSGMAAITATLLTVVQQGDRIVASNTLYGRTTQLLNQELPRYGVQTTFVDSG